MRLLLVEDDAMIGRAIRQGLGEAGFTVDWVTDGRAAELALANGVYDLAVLDRPARQDEWLSARPSRPARPLRC
jgi:DNA-binding response OmpR family regulator